MTPIIEQICGGGALASTDSISSLYAEIHSSTSISSRRSMMAISLQMFSEGNSRAQVTVPSGARSAHQVEYLAWLHSREAFLLTFVIQSCHEALQDVQRRQASHAAAVKRQQTEAGIIDRVWLFAVVLSQRLRHRRVWYSGKDKLLGSGRG
jgi:hypothetical protein